MASTTQQQALLVPLLVGGIQVVLGADRAATQHRHSQTERALISIRWSGGL